MTGAKTHKNKIKKIIPKGAIENIFLFPLSGKRYSFKKSLTASAKGCRTPPALTLFGPFRACLKPKILRSNKVKNATFTKTGITINIYLEILDKIILENFTFEASTHCSF